MGKTMKCFIDGDHLCVVKDDFINLQESPAMFLKLSEEDTILLKNMERSSGVRPMKTVTKLLEERWCIKKKKDGNFYNRLPMKYPWPQYLLDAINEEFVHVDSIANIDTATCMGMSLKNVDVMKRFFKNYGFDPESETFENDIKKFYTDRM